MKRISEENSRSNGELVTDCKCKKKGVIRDFAKRITLKRMIILIFLLMFNSYAWFIYATKVFNSITTHVAAWEIKFQYGENEIINSMSISVPMIYPGMDEFFEEIDATNLGEKDAILTYAIREVTILGKTYSTIRENSTQEDRAYTPGELYEMLTDGTYPFELEIIVANNGEMEAKTGTCTIIVYIRWKFELEGENVTQEEIDQKDALDTEYGELAYEFYEENSTLPSIELKIDVIATQVLV